MLLDVADSQLLLVDYQERLMPAIHDGEAVIANALRLGRIAQALQVPVWGTEQNPAGLGPNVAEVRALCARTLAKTHFSACADGLVDWLRPVVAAQRGGNVRSLPRHLQKGAAETAPGRNTIVVAGCETHVCMMQTSLDLLDQEFDVCVVTDACGSRTERNRDAAFDRLAGAGAELVTTEMVAFEWLRGSDHPQFRAILALAK
jgi:nicotinamidase-related amidase